jgi:toxin HigB-1
VIVSIRHKELTVLVEEGGTAGVKPQHVRKRRLPLAALHSANTIEDMNVPGWRLHWLKGARASTWSISVDKNWRMTFEFSNGNVYYILGKHLRLHLGDPRFEAKRGIKAS